MDLVRLIALALLPLLFDVVEGRRMMLGTGQMMAAERAAKSFAQDGELLEKSTFQARMHELRQVKHAVHPCFPPVSSWFLLRRLAAPPAPLPSSALFAFELWLDTFFLPTILSLSPSCHLSFPRYPLTQGAAVFRWR